jgi:hypothetical protein
MEHGSETLLEGSLIDIATQRSISTWEFGEASIPVSYRRHGRSSGMCLYPLYDIRFPCMANGMGANVVYLSTAPGKFTRRPPSMIQHATTGRGMTWLLRRSGRNMRACIGKGVSADFSS